MRMFVTVEVPVISLGLKVMIMLIINSLSICFDQWIKSITKFD